MPFNKKFVGRIVFFTYNMLIKIGNLLNGKGYKEKIFNLQHVVVV